jgi:hypothetical protein
MSEYEVITDHTQIRPDDLLEYRCPKFGIVTQWRVVGVRLAGEGYQSMIDVLPVTKIAIDPAPFSVPEQMTRSLTIIRRDEAPHD